MIVEAEKPTTRVRTLTSDAELVAACVSGGGAADAFRELVQRHKGMVMYAAFRVLKDHHEAEDVSQEAFVKAYRALGTLRDGSDFGSWVTTIARNTALSRAATRARRPIESGDVVADAPAPERPGGGASGDPSSAAAARELHGLVLRELEGISEAHRRTIYLKFVKGYTCAEIAQMEGTGVSAITSRLSRATAMLREKLTRLAGGRTT
jgi:RNA polymerase sigma-70 factor (ECF subfamily)